LDTLTIKVSKSDVTFNVKASTIESDSILIKLFSNPSSAKATEEWLSVNESLFTINDDRLKDAIENLDYHDKLSRSIRDMRSNHIGPFGLTADSDFISVPGDYRRIPDSTVFTWLGSDLNNAILRLQDPVTLNTMDVKCSDGMGLKFAGYKKRVNFQMNRITAMRLFMLKNTGQINDEMKVFVTVLRKAK